MKNLLSEELERYKQLSNYNTKLTLVENTEVILEQPSIATTMKELEVYAENTRSLMLYMNLHLLGIDDKRSNLAASHLGRALGICDVLKKTPYYLAVHRGYIPTDILMKHNLFFDRIWSRVGGEGIVVDEFYDVVLELGAYAKKHL